jgi:hypothetical protein
MEEVGLVTVALPENRASAFYARPKGAVLGTDFLEIVAHTLSGPIANPVEPPANSTAAVSANAGACEIRELNPDVPMAGARHRLLGGGGRLPVVLIVVNLR